MAELLVLGGGLLGGALARLAAKDEGRVTLASRTPANHAGMWLRFDAATMPPAALVERIPRARRGDTSLVVAVAPGPKEDEAALYREQVPRVVEAAVAAGFHSVVSVVALGAEGTERWEWGKGPPPQHLVRVGPLYGPGDRWVSPLLPPLREGGLARYTRGLPTCAPLHVEDAARAVLRLLTEPEGRSWTLLGPESLTPEAAAATLARRFGARCEPRWIGKVHPRDTRVAATSGPDDWDDARFGPRVRFEDWVERLPGPRRRRYE